MDHSIPTTFPFLAWGVGVPLAHIALILLFRGMGLWDFKTRRGSRASDIMAFELVAGGCVVYLAIVGCVGWFRLCSDWKYDAIFEDKFYGHAQFVEDHLIAPMLGYQFWNFVLCFLNKDLFDPAMIGHHFVTGSLAFIGLHPYLHYYGLFFFGFAELTNIPLTFVDIFKYFPDLKEKFSAVNEVSRVVFALSFFIIRLGMWPIISYEFIMGSVDLLQSGKAHSNFAVAYFLGANAFLTGLQFLWGSKIFGFLFKKEKKAVKEDGEKKKA